MAKFNGSFLLPFALTSAIRAKTASRCQQSELVPAEVVGSHVARDGPPHAWPTCTAAYNAGSLVARASAAPNGLS